MADADMSCTVGGEAPAPPDVLRLMDELSDTLEAITGSSGRLSFSPDDLSGPGSLLAVARDGDGTAIGCGAIRPLDTGVAEIKRMYVREKSRGIGSAILTYLEAQAADMGYHTIRLETRRINRDAVAFYLARGYSTIANYGRYMGRPEAVCFEKKLMCETSCREKRSITGKEIMMNEWNTIVNTGEKVWSNIKDKMKDWTDEITEKSGEAAGKTKAIMDNVADKINEQSKAWVKKAEVHGEVWAKKAEAKRAEWALAMAEKSGATAEQARKTLDTVMDKIETHGEEWAAEAKRKGREWSDVAKEKSREWADELAQNTGATAEQTRRMLDTAMDKAKAQGQEWTQEAKKLAAEWSNEARSKREEWAEEIAQRSGATAEQAKEVLSNVADKIRSQGVQWKEKTQNWEPPVLKNYVRRDQVQQMIQEELDAALKERDQ